MKQCLYDLSLNDLSSWLREREEKPFRAKQILEWAYGKNAPSFAAMTNLPAALREALDEAFSIGPIEPAATSTGRDATKLLLPMPGGGEVECVRIHMGGTYTACLSSQVGCAVGCAFCATGQMRCERSLDSAEIIQQFVTLRGLGEPISNVVFMGMGEPFHNYSNVVAAVRRLVDRQAFGMSPSRITVSTAGVAPMIRRYAQEGLATELAVSLNAPDDALRRRLMPGVARWPIADILSACAEFSKAHGGQPVTFAYVLIDGVNDDLDHAKALGELLAGQPHHLNVIPLNPVAHTTMKAPERDRTWAFVHHCHRYRLNVSLRRSKGAESDAACGQLRTNTRLETPEGAPSITEEEALHDHQPGRNPRRDSRTPKTDGSRGGGGAGQRGRSGQDRSRPRHRGGGAGRRPRRD